MIFDVAVQGVENFGEIQVIVQGQLDRLGVQSERAQRAGQRAQDAKQFLGMAMLGESQVAQRSERRVHGVPKPEVGDLPRGDASRQIPHSGIRRRQDPAFLREDLHQLVANQHQARAGADVQAGRHELWIHRETRAVTDHSRDRNHLQAIQGFGIQKQAQILARQENRALILAGALIEERPFFRRKTHVSGLQIGRQDAIPAGRRHFGNSEHQDRAKALSAERHR